MAEVSEFSVEKVSGGGTSFWGVFAAPERQLLRPRPLPLISALVLGGNRRVGMDMSRPVREEMYRMQDG